MTFFQGKIKTYFSKNEKQAGARCCLVPTNLPVSRDSLETYSGNHSLALKILVWPSQSTILQHKYHSSIELFFSAKVKQCQSKHVFSPSLKASINIIHLFHNITLAHCSTYWPINYTSTNNVFFKYNF